MWTIRGWRSRCHVRSGLSIVGLAVSDRCQQLHSNSLACTGTNINSRRQTYTASRHGGGAIHPAVQHPSITSTLIALYSIRRSRMPAYIYRVSLTLAVAAFEWISASTTTLLIIYTGQLSILIKRESSISALADDTSSQIIDRDDLYQYCSISPDENELKMQLDVH